MSKVYTVESELVKALIDIKENGKIYEMEVCVDEKSI